MEQGKRLFLYSIVPIVNRLMLKGDDHGERRDYLFFPFP